MDYRGIELFQKYKLLYPHLDERSRRLVAAADTYLIGFGGVTIVSKACGLSRVALTKGKKELQASSGLSDKVPAMSEGRVRKEGAGRKKLVDNQQNIKQALEKLVGPHTLGDPENPLIWTSKSLRSLGGELVSQGYKVSYVTVGALLKEMGYSLQSNRKTNEGGGHPDRDAQFEYINQQTIMSVQNDGPVISVDTKKKELVGNFKNAGSEWAKKGAGQQVNVYDFPSLSEGKAIPYGVYDIEKNTGWVNVGVDHDTPQFAVASIKGWWHAMGKQLYKEASTLLVHADSGGSNSARSRMWKKELQALSNQTGLTISVCHFPPGTSKWNKIEHRMFSQITKNWRGKPLVSYETVVNLIGATKTTKGLTIKANLDQAKYQKGLKVSDQEMDMINITKHDFHGEWNYTISPSNM